MKKSPLYFYTYLVLCFILLFLPGYNAYAQVDSNVELEWEKNPNAKKYDLEIKSAKSTFRFTVVDSAWQGRLSPGNFKMRVRARDKRGAPGDWSAFQEFTVSLDSPKLISPKVGAEIQSDEKSEQNIKLAWLPVRLATKYKINIESVDGVYKKNYESEKNKLSIDLPVAQKYKITIQAANDVLVSDPKKDLPVEITVIGAKLETAEIESPASTYVRELVWKKVQFSQNYNVQLDRLDPVTKKYNSILINRELPENQLDFKSQWLGGYYRLSVQAKSIYRKSSDVFITKFNVKDGDRSKNTEDLDKLRESIDRLSGWFLTASYLITSVDYTNLNYDSNSGATGLNFSAIGATARLGFGHMTAKNSWGFFAATEVSSLKVNGYGGVDYKTFEIDSIYKTQPSAYGDIRQFYGLYYKELPVLVGALPGQFSNQQQSKLSALGFRAGAEYWQAITPKLGLQVNGHLFSLLKKVETPNSNAIEPSISLQAGVLASYRLNQKLTTLFGYAYRLDQLKYKNSYQNISSTQQKSRSEADEVKIKGHYINLMLEYQL